MVDLNARMTRSLAEIEFHTKRTAVARLIIKTPIFQVTANQS
jgi:hypothetical protein